ncbi:MAG: hypothetical protein JOZ58_12065 [Acetobacteraceae bacterium]|nr:hypothetical protein [Alphaproteobacteria bacterium]MBV8575754.1 hypothetical protein [Acetobacteraceae bacterium]
MKNTTFLHDVHAADWQPQERGSRSDRAVGETTPTLNPAVAWSTALLVSLGLWWGIWLAVSSLASVLV